MILQADHGPLSGIRYRNFANLDDFLAYFNKAMDVLIDESDFAALAFAYLERVATDGLKHAEIFFDPQAHTGRGVSLDVVVKGLKKGLAKVGSPMSTFCEFRRTLLLTHLHDVQGQTAFGITSDLIMCFVKHLPVSEALVALRAMGPLVLGADSSEVNNPRKQASLFPCLGMSEF